MWASILKIIENVTKITILSQEQRVRLERDRRLKIIRKLEKKLANLKSDVDLAISKGEDISILVGKEIYYERELLDAKRDYESYVKEVSSI